ncbi:WD40/YVTN/BNR-like repeat-containing protein [Flavobacterium sp. XGLA_31]|uniref:WD40/YVTN/BNR-like repeat-containing protein n=1 Tax=Flavobacterium sp. XGLA_31 TaxID=3447666 RepID=UPI003F2F047D
MKNYFLFFSALFSLFNNISSFHTEVIPYQSIAIDTILKERISIRAILVDNDKLWYAGDDNHFGYYSIKTGELIKKQIQNDSGKLEFRSIAQTKEALFVANIWSPAFIFKINKLDLSWEKVYTETHKNAFYDSMNFWNNKEGIAIGDPTENCLSILVTRNAGRSWEKINCNELPKMAEGEAAFAASNTNICIKGSKTWIVSGGVKSRVFFSPDKGVTWQVTETPIVQGKAMTGIFTSDFYNDQLGFVAGGNYEVPEQNFQNKAITTDGGKTWQLIAENTGFGYASCIQFVPKSNGKQLVAVGATGLHYSADGGKSWKILSEDKTLFTIRFVDEKTAFAAGKDKIIRIRFKK